MIFNLILILLFSKLSFGFNKDLRTINDRVPLEFNHLFDSLKGSISSTQEKNKFINLCKELNENLGLLQKEHIFLLMKSEVIKHTLEYKHKKYNTHSVTTSLISQLEKDFQNKDSLSYKFGVRLTDFISRVLGSPDRGVKSERVSQHKKLGILNLGAGCSVLIEVEFITNAPGMANYNSKKEILAKGVTEISQRFDDLVK